MAVGADREDVGWKVARNSYTHTHVSIGMAYATGLRFSAAACWMIGGFTLILIPVLWPLGYVLYKQAKEKEAEREAELAALAND